MVERYLNETFYCTLLVHLVGERAQTRFGGLTSVLELPAAADPRWLVRTTRDLGAGGTFIGAMAVWMVEQDIRLVGVAVDAGLVCPLERSIVELASGALRLRMRRTCHEADVAWVSQATMLKSWDDG